MSEQNLNQSKALNTPYRPRSINYSQSKNIYKGKHELTEDEISKAITEIVKNFASDFNHCNGQVEKLCFTAPNEWVYSTYSKKLLRDVKLFMTIKIDSSSMCFFSVAYFSD